MKTSAQKKQKDTGNSQTFKSEVGFRELLEAANETITVVQDGKIKYANYRITKLTGYTRDEIDTMDAYDIIHPDDRERVRKVMAERVKGIDIPDDYTFRIYDKNKKIKWLNRNVSLIEWEGRKASLVMDNDITALKEVEEDLNHSLEWEKAIFESSRDAIFISDQNSRFIYVNKAASELTGYTRSQLLRMRIPDIHDHPDLEAYKLYHKRILDGEEILSEAKVLRKDGTKTDTEFNNRCVIIVGKKYMHTTARNITERKQAEELLKESSWRLNEAQKLAHIGIWDWKRDTDTATWTDELYHITGLDPMLPAPTYKELFRLFTPESMELLNTGVEKAIETGESYQFELELMRPNGDTRYVNAFGGAKFDSKGQVNGLFGTVQDITERKLAEEELRESEERYRRLVEISPDAIAVHSKGRFVFVNPAGAKLIGTGSPQELIGKPLLDVVHPDSRSQVVERLRQVAKGKEAPLFEEKLLKLDGSVIDVEVVGIPFSYQGQIATQIVVRDITGRKRIEEALQLEKENFRCSLDASPLGVRIVTTEGDTIYANQTILNFYGYDSLGKLQQTPLKDRYTQESYIQAQKRKRQRERGDLSATKYEVSIVRKNGEIRHLQVFRKEVLWDGISQFQILYDDITERKLAEDGIIKSKKLLEDLHKHLDEIRENERALISREIHDQIGQSLTALKLDLNWMNKYIKNIYPEAAAKLHDMIELVTGTIKDVQRISSELRPGILDDLGLAAAIEWYCDEFEKRTAIKCSLRLDDSIFGDSQKNLVFFRVLQEALTNVIRHANASSVTIKLHQTQKGTTLTIQDNGIGIAAEMIESTNALGLIGMRERVKQFSGAIDISSKKGDGTKLTIFIPEEKKIML